MSITQTRLPVTVVTGFLGAGKTTVLRHLLINSGLKLAVVVNEFGEVGIDGALLRACGFCPEEELEDRLVELANGCLCCTVQDDFLPTMERLLERADQLDGIVVETSGLALPEPLVAAFNWPAIRARTHVHAVVTVVDGEALAGGQVVADSAALEAQRRADPSLDHSEAIEDLFDDQLQAADLVLLSRADRLQAEQIAALQQGLAARCRAGTAVLPCTAGEIAPQLLLGERRREVSTTHHDHEHEHDHDHEHEHEHDDSHEHDHSHVPIESLALTLPGVWHPQTLEPVLQQLIEHQHLLRVKGWLAIPGKPRLFQLQAVGPRLNTWYEGNPDLDPASGAVEPLLQLVMLGFRLNRVQIEAQLLACRVDALA